MSAPAPASPTEAHHACLESDLYLGHLVEDPGNGDEAEVFEAVPCSRCAGEAGQRS